MEVKTNTMQIRKVWFKMINPIMNNLIYLMVEVTKTLLQIKIRFYKTSQIYLMDKYQSEKDDKINNYIINFVYVYAIITFIFHI